jgi:hypothetical protein
MISKEMKERIPKFIKLEKDIFRKMTIHIIKNTTYILLAVEKRTHNGLKKKTIFNRSLFDRKKFFFIKIKLIKNIKDAIQPKVEFHVRNEFPIFKPNL